VNFYFNLLFEFFIFENKNIHNYQNKAEVREEDPLSTYNATIPITKLENGIMNSGPGNSAPLADAAIGCVY
jgi:hypothetical protein